MAATIAASLLGPNPFTSRTRPARAAASSSSMPPTPSASCRRRARSAEMPRTCVISRTAAGAAARRRAASCDSPRSAISAMTAASAAPIPGTSVSVPAASRRASCASDRLSTASAPAWYARARNGFSPDSRRRAPISRSSAEIARRSTLARSTRSASMLKRLGQPGVCRAGRRLAYNGWVRVVALASAFWLVAACSGPGAPPATPAAAKQRRPAPPTDAAPAWMRGLQGELSALRGLSFTRPVPFSSQTRAQFREKVRGELTRELPPVKAGGLSRAYAALGFGPAEFDLARALEEAVTSEVLAYYEPETRAFRVIADGPVESSKAATTSVLSHELVHALQDQSFDLRRFLADVDPADR